MEDCILEKFILFYKYIFLKIVTFTAHPYFMTLYQKNCYALLFVISILALVLIALISQASASNNFFSNKANVLRSASELDYPPFSIIRPDGTPDGFSVELLTEVTKAAGLKV